MRLTAADLRRGRHPLNEAFLIKHSVTFDEAGAIADDLADLIEAAHG